MRKIIFILIIIFIFLPCQAQANDKNIFSLDLSYSLTSLLSQGWGIGLNYEKKLFDYMSLKVNFEHMTFLTNIKDVYCTSVHLSLFANYYPIGSGMDKLYIGIGNGCDFMNYFGNGKLPDSNQDILIHLTPQTGWKFRIIDILMIDASIGYKFIITDSQNYLEIKNYANDGFRLGLKFLLFFNKIRKEKQDDKT